MLLLTSLSVEKYHSVAWKAHDGPISFIKKFPYINDDATIIASGSHDKSLKFWSVPTEWLEFKKQAKAKLAKDRAEKETTATTSTEKEKTEPEKPKKEEPEKPKPEEPKPVEPTPEKPKPKKKKEPEPPKEEPEPAKVKEEVVHDLDKPEDSAKKPKKQSKKANLFDSDGDEDKEFN